MYLEPRKPDLDQQNLTNLAGKTNLDEVILRVLINRGIDTEEKIHKFINASLDDLTDPFSFCGMYEAVERIKAAIAREEKILIYADYDCDGTGAAAILYLALKNNKVPPNYYIPVRADEGYGLNKEAIERIKKDFNPDLIITVDLGITSVEEVAYVKRLGMDIIVTDHHRRGEVLPDCIIVNPCLNPDLTQLCGAGVAFMLVHAIFGKEEAIKYLDICAISTVADIVPLFGDNRIIVKHGIEKIRSGKCRKGIKQLIFSAGLRFQEVFTSDISFKIAPRLNASGRLNTALSSLKLLVEDDPAAINMISEALELYNKERQKLNSDILDEARELLKSYDLGKNRIIVLEKDDWNEGVIGIVAAKLVEEFNKPTILFTRTEDGLYKGSARSITGVNVHEVLTHCQHLLRKFGGHAMAAGLALEPSRLNEFLSAANDFIAANYSQSALERRISYDALLSIRDIDDKLFDALLRLEPYGYGNPRPVFVDDAFECDFSRISATNHVKMRTRRGDVVYFNGYSQIEYLNGHIHKLVYTPERNYFNGREYNKFLVKEIIPNGEIPAKSVLIKRYLATFVTKFYTPDDFEPVEKKYPSPVLYITFDGERYKKFVDDNIDVNKFIFNGEVSSSDSIVLSPDKYFPFAYYNKIVVLDEISGTYANYLRTKVKTVELRGQKTSYTLKKTVHELREDYIFILRTVGTSYRYVDEAELYKFLVGFGYMKQYADFLASFYTFIDVGLIKAPVNGILSIINIKVDLTKSALYNYLSRE